MNETLSTNLFLSPSLSLCPRSILYIFLPTHTTNRRRINSFPSRWLYLTWMAFGEWHTIRNCRILLIHIIRFFSICIPNHFPTIGFLSSLDEKPSFARRRCASWNVRLLDNAYFSIHKSLQQKMFCRLAFAVKMKNANVAEFCIAKHFAQNWNDN